MTSLFSDNLACELFSCQTERTKGKKNAKKSDHPPKPAENQINDHGCVQRWLFTQAPIHKPPPKMSIQKEEISIEPNTTHYVGCVGGDFPNDPVLMRLRAQFLEITKKTQ